MPLIIRFSQRMLIFNTAYPVASRRRIRRDRPLFLGIAVLAAWLALVPAGSASAGEAAGTPRQIDVITPQWDGQTNADGTGLFFDIVRRVYAPEGIELHYRFAPWKRAQKTVDSGAADAMLCVWREHAKEEGQVIPRFPLFVEYTAVVFRKDRIKDWNGLTTLDGKSAVWLRGYDYHTFAHFAAVHFSSWAEVDDYPRAWELIERGHYNAYIDALIDIEHYIDEHAIDMAPYRLEILWGEKAYVAFFPSAKSETLMRIYDRRIQELAASGELKDIYGKWGGRYTPEAWDPATNPPQ